MPSARLSLRSSSFALLGLFAGLGCAAPAASEPATAAVVDLAPAPAPAPSAPPPAAKGEAEASDTATEPSDEDEEGEGIERGDGQSGVLAVLQSSDGAAFGGLLGEGLELGGIGDGTGLGGLGAPGGGGIGTGQGFGAAQGRLGQRGSPSAKVAVGTTTVSGRLPPEIIRRIVQRNVPRLRYCYEKGLTTNPTLTGKVVVRFVIEKDGSVGAVSDGGSSMPDAAVTSCVLATFQSIAFPTPEGGVVVVVYPIVFSSGEPPPAQPAPPAGSP